TDRGIGTGISLLIFAGIVSRLPSGAGNIYQYLVGGRISFFNLLLLLAIGVLVIAAVVLVQEGQRKIPVQYAKRVVGRKIYGGQSSFIPMKVNQAGVIPVIFAASVLAFPVTVASFFHTGWAATIERYFGFRTPLYTILYALLIVFFTYFYTAVTFNPMDVANNIKKYGGFIPGLRPGRPTAEHLGRILERITLPGAIFLALIAVLPNFVMIVTDIPGLYFGGTALLIVVGVALETMKQIEAHLLMRHYQGFVK
ncbi:MAG: preprotein translocase subunit SecY, partial [Firmicutes bacterium]|nr:preprotein translocase subunit SecY [Bacillota bacterium]